MATFIVLAVVTGIVAFAIYQTVRQKKSGGCSGCGSDCNRCGGHTDRKAG